MARTAGVVAALAAALFIFGCVVHGHRKVSIKWETGLVIEDEVQPDDQGNVDFHVGFDPLGESVIRDHYIEDDDESGGG